MTRMVEYHVGGERHGQLTDRENRVWKALSLKTMKTSYDLGNETDMASNDASEAVKNLCRRKMAKCMVNVHGIGSNTRPKMPYYYLKTKMEDEGETENDLHVTLRDARPPAPVLQAE